MKKIRFIINPRSGTSKKRGLETLIAEHIDNKKFSYEILNTEYAGHAQQLAARSVKDKVDIIVACGGDGTVNEIARPLIGTELAMAVLPLGSGNGFASHIGMPNDLKSSIGCINREQIKRIDTGRINDKIFVNVAGIGFDGLISYRIKKGKSRGLWMYLKTSFTEMWNYKAIELAFEIDNVPHHEKLATLAIANGSMYGNNFKIAPSANITDGKLEVIIIKNAKVYQYLLQAYRFLNGSIYNSPLVSHTQATYLKINNNSSLYYHVDGEGLYTEKKIEVSIIPASLNVIIGNHVN